MNKSKGHIHLIIGASKLGAAIATKRAKEGQYVTIIDKDNEARYKLGDNFLGSFLCGDATFITVLEEANIEKAKEVVIVTDSDDTNLYLANMLFKIYEKENIVIRLNDIDKADLLLNKKTAMINPFIESFFEYENIASKEDK